MEDKNKIVISGKIKIITPTHIGGSQEKHWIQGLDFIQPRDSDHLYIIDEQKTIKLMNGVENYSKNLASGSLASFLESKSHETYSKVVIKDVGVASSEVKRMQHNPLDDKILLPGSSLKGAIRSVLFNYFASKSSIKPRNENDIFGGISNDILRFIHIRDVFFDQSDFWNSKIYNLMGRNFGTVNDYKSGWKYARETRRDFRETGFNLIYETLKIGQVANFEIVFDVNNFIKSANTLRPPLGTKELFNENFKERLKNILTEYMKKYIAKELKWFEKYNQAEEYNNIKENLEMLKIKSENSILIRLGAGSGFHAITGDWQHGNSHIIEEYVQSNNPNLNGKLKYKSRKLAFKFNSDEDRYQFYPMGFAELIFE